MYKNTRLLRNGENETIYTSIVPYSPRLWIFYHYLEFPMMDKKLTNSQIAATWSLKLGRILGRLNSPVREYRFITKMLLRLRRVQFMRAFDVKCCLDGTPNTGHESFDKVIQDVYIVLLTERANIVKNNPHITF